jgi:hypothetical protein
VKEARYQLRQSPASTTESVADCAKQSLADDRLHDLFEVDPTRAAARLANVAAIS